VISNGYDALFLQTGREVRPIPSRPTSEPPAQTTASISEWKELLDLLRFQGGVIAFFHDPTRRGMVDEERPTSALPLCASLSAKEGTLYRLCE
jgi:hypothetical protein